MSIRAQVLNLLNNMKKSRGLTYLFIAHDLSVVRFISDRIAVISKGRIVELAEAEELFLHPLHPYTKALLSAVPIPDPGLEKEKNSWSTILRSMTIPPISPFGKRSPTDTSSMATRRSWRVTARSTNPSADPNTSVIFLHLPRRSTRCGGVFAFCGGFCFFVGKIADMRLFLRRTKPWN